MKKLVNLPRVLALFLVFMVGCGHFSKDKKNQSPDDRKKISEGNETPGDADDLADKTLRVFFDKLNKEKEEIKNDQDMDRFLVAGFLTSKTAKDNDLEVSEKEGLAISLAFIEVIKLQAESFDAFSAKYSQYMEEL